MSKFWSSTAVVVAYDDSDGWYDRVASTIQNASTDAANNSAICTSAHVPVSGGYQDRCGPGPRLPLLAISPNGKTTVVDHTATEQSSILKFIEDNWNTGRIGDSSFEHRAGSLCNLFDFRRSDNKQVVLNQNGSIASIRPIIPLGAWCFVRHQPPRPLLAIRAGHEWTRPRTVLPRTASVVVKIFLNQGST